VSVAVRPGAAQACDGELVAVVAGPRRAAEDAQAIERAAAAIARTHGVTVRQLAAAAGISERAANDRYRKVSVFDPATLDSNPILWKPEPPTESS
jgi:hypothetical protein